MAESGITRNEILSELARSPHGKLDEYVPICRKAVDQEPEFLAHLVAWNRLNGSIRDSQIALPIISLSAPGMDAEFVENASAHVGLLRPRELERAYRFAWSLRDAAKEGDRSATLKRMRRVIARYLRGYEANWPKWERLAVQHRHTLANLYALTHTKPGSDRINDVLFRGVRPEGSLFDLVARLKDMSPAEAAGTIIERRIPFLIAMGALGEKAKETDLALALIGRMSPTELVTNAKMLERMGVKTNPALRGAFEAALTTASKSKANVLKSTRAAEAIGDEDLGEKLRGLQERQLSALGGVDGNWLVIADKSGSMAHAIELAKQIASVLAKMVAGKVWLAFVNTSPQVIDVTGKTYDEIVKASRSVVSGGGTSIGCGLQWTLDSKIEVDGVAIISDGGENNTPYFADAYARYAKWSGKDVPVYLYRCLGDADALSGNMRRAGIDMQEFDMTRGVVDFYSLPNLVGTMRTNRYSLVDEVMATKLLTLADVFGAAGKEDESNVAVA